MFRRRTKLQNSEPVFSVQAHASLLGIERRLAPRILYPCQNLNSLPTVFFGARALPVRDVSEGGVCLIDDQDHMGPHAGHEVELRLVWPDCERRVRCRLVSRVDNRRHIQFLDLERERREAIRSAIRSGVRGQAMRAVLSPVGRAIEVEAQEIWSSAKNDNDCTIFFHDVHVIAELILEGAPFRVLKNSWPVDADGRAVSVADVEKMVIFLGNFPMPSLRVTSLKDQLQRLLREGPP